MKFTIEIVQDCDPESPREWDNLGTMVCWHKRYVLGDEQPKESPEGWLECLAESLDTSNRMKYWDRECAEEQYQKAVEQILEREIIMLPLYLYDHSGVTMSTKPFSCPWDSGQIGYIYVTLEDVRREWSCKRVSAKRRVQAEQRLVAEVEVYNGYLRGDVYGYTILDENDHVVDSCWGFYGLDEVRKDVLEALRVAL